MLDLLMSKPPFPSGLKDGKTAGWYDFTDLFYVSRDIYNFVSQVRDKSGNFRHFNQLIVNAQPILGVDGITFDGVNDFLKTDPFTLNQPEIIYAVFKENTWTDLDTILDGNAGNTMRLYQRTASGTLRILTGTSNVDNNTSVVNTFQIVTAMFNSTNSFLQINNRTKVAGNAGTGNAGGLTVGGSNITGNYANVTFKELIIRQDLSDYDNIKLYLSRKHGIPI